MVLTLSIGTAPEMALVLREIQVKINIFFPLLWRTLINLRIQPANNKTRFQIKQAGSEVIVLPLRVDAVVSALLRNRFSLFYERFCYPH